MKEMEMAGKTFALTSSSDAHSLRGSSAQAIEHWFGCHRHFSTLFSIRQMIIITLSFHWNSNTGRMGVHNDDTILILKHNTSYFQVNSESILNVAKKLPRIPPNELWSGKRI